jgi:hypothetical protein
LKACSNAKPFKHLKCMQDKLHLYFLFDLMPGGDLMDVLVAEARVIKRRIPQGALRRACFAPKVYSRRPASWSDPSDRRPVGPSRSIQSCTSFLPMGLVEAFAVHAMGAPGHLLMCGWKAFMDKLSCGPARTKYL